MTMSERCLIPYNHQLSAVKFIAQARFGATAKAPEMWSIACKSVAG